MAYVTVEQVKEVQDLSTSIEVNGGKWTDAMISDVIILQEALFDSRISKSYTVPLVTIPTPTIVILCITHMVSYSILQQGYGSLDDTPDEFLHLKTTFDGDKEKKIKGIIDMLNGGDIVLEGETKNSTFGLPIVKMVAGSVRYLGGSLR